MSGKKSIVLTDLNVFDLECILDGSYHPLIGFMNEIDYHSVLDTTHLSTGQIWAIPITLHVTEVFEISTQIVLKDSTLLPLATLTIESVYKPNIEKECMCIYQTLDTNHPGVQNIINNTGYYIGGTLKKINSVQHYDFLSYRLNPSQVKEYFTKNNWTQIVGFQTRNPLHRCHVELTKLALEIVGKEAKLLLHPVVGKTQECDVDYITRCKCYKEILKYYPDNTVKLAFLPYHMRMAGPREALQHAIIRQNYECTHFIIGRDHAGPSYKNKNGESFYGPYDAQQYVLKYQEELKIKIIIIPQIVYIKELGYVREDQIPSEYESGICNISGTELRKMLTSGIKIPEWYTYPEIATILSSYYSMKGICFYLIGLSGAGKSTLSLALKSRLEEITDRQVSILDGDKVRQTLSAGLGFSKQDRSANVRRIGYVASEIVKHGGIVICANIAPYDEDRLSNRELISKVGNYIEVFLDTDINTCEQRDPKGLYKSFRAGKLKNLTGIDDPFEKPSKADVIIKNESILNSTNILISKYHNIIS